MSGNQDLASALHAALVHQNSVCHAYYPPNLLLHMLHDEELMAALHNDSDKFYQLDWKRLARRQPHTAVACVRLALVSSSNNSRRRGRIWRLVPPSGPSLESMLVCRCVWLLTRKARVDLQVTPAIRVLLERRVFLDKILQLVLDFPMPGKAFPPPLDKLKSLMLPSIKALESGTCAQFPHMCKEDCNIHTLPASST